MKFIVKFSNEEKTIEFPATRSSLWRAQDMSTELPDTPSKSARMDYLWGYTAAKQANKLEELGIFSDMSPIDIADFLGDTYDLDISEGGKKNDPFLVD